MISQNLFKMATVVSSADYCELDKSDPNYVLGRRPVVELVVPLPESVCSAELPSTTHPDADIW